MRWPISDNMSRMCGYLDKATGLFYRWKVLPWGTNVAPFIQQTLMTAVKRWLEDKFPFVSAYVFYDDFLVCG